MQKDVTVEGIKALLDWLDQNPEDPAQSIFATLEELRMRLELRAVFKAWRIHEDDRRLMSIVKYLSIRPASRDEMQLGPDGPLVDIKADGANKALKRARDRGFVTRMGKRGPWKLTATGEELARALVAAKTARKIINTAPSTQAGKDW